MKNFIYFALAFLSIVELFGCGGEVSEDRFYDNPLDPNKEEVVAPEVEKASTDEVAVCLAGQCTTASGASFDFTGHFTVTPPGCEARGDLKLFDTGENLHAFVRAYCGLRTFVYFMSVSYEGSIIGSPVNVSESCTTGSDGAVGLDVDRGDSGYLTAYDCKTGTSSYSTFISSMSFSGVVDHTHNFANYSDYVSNRKYVVSWNDGSSSFGLAYKGHFQRFSSGAVPIGGPIMISSASLRGLKSMGGSWVLIQDANGGGNSCSKISGGGILQCNAKPVYAGFIGFFDSSSLVTSNSKFNDGNAFNFRKLDFSFESCATSGESDRAFVNNAEYNLWKNYPMGAVRVSSTVGAVLHRTSSSLIVSSLPMSGTFAVQAEASVASYTELDSAEIYKIHSRVYVAFVDDDEAEVYFSSILSE